MSRNHFLSVVGLLTLAILVSGFAEEEKEAIAFVAPVVAQMEKEGARVRFAVNRETDVEVTVLDAKGKIVRHLAAGMLGKNAPLPLKSDALEQELIWDFKDDGGKTTNGGPFSVRVRAGLKPEFGRFIGACPQQQGMPVGLGSVGKDFLGTHFFKFGQPYWSALSPDGKTIYACYSKGKDARDPGTGRAVYRADWNPKIEPTLFLGEPGIEGDGPKQFRDPRGLATDKDGNLYVCDYGNNRVSIFSLTGESLAQICVQEPDAIAVHPQTGAIYILAMMTPEPLFGWPKAKWKKGKLVKFESYKGSQPAAQLDLGDCPLTTMFCLDSAAEHPIVWIAPWGEWKSIFDPLPRDILKVLDMGKSFEKKGCPISEKITPGAVTTGVQSIAVDAERDEIYVGDYDRVPRTVVAQYPKSRFDGLNGKFLGEVNFPHGTGGGELVVGKDGFFYHNRGNTDGLLTRATHDGKPAPWPGTGKHVLSGFPQGHCFPRGHTIGPDGTLYILHHSASRKWEEAFVSKVAPDGKTVQKGIIQFNGIPVGGIQVDRQGNIYVGVHVKPKDKRVPDWFAEKPEAIDYERMYGSLLKFPPTGGSVKVDPEGELLVRWCSPKSSIKTLFAKASEVIWMYYGVFAPYRGVGCACQQARFAVDDYGRVFLQDPFRFLIVVLDTYGNVITRFGGYGNQDSGGPQSAISMPEIPLGWPKAIGVTDRMVYTARGSNSLYSSQWQKLKFDPRMVYIADTVNHRVVAVKLSAKTEVFCSIKN